MLVIKKHIAISSNLVKVNGDGVFTYDGEDGYKKFIFFGNVPDKECQLNSCKEKEDAQNCLGD